LESAIVFAGDVLMRTTAATNSLFSKRTVLRVVTFGALAREWSPGVRLLVRVESRNEVAILARLSGAGVGDLAVLGREGPLLMEAGLPTVLETGPPLEDGDVVAVTPTRRGVDVLFRESDVHHTVFLTNRCNSHCLMCSQPPTSHDDSWLVAEALEVAAHIRVAPSLIGFTGGEPLLLGDRLRDVLEGFARYLPGLRMDVLTNGRLFSDRSLARTVLEGMTRPVTWMVPLYGHADFLHDFVVQTPGAFDETIEGLLTLQAYRQPIQLRTVLIDPVLQVLPELCKFIGRNLPFVREVALMGCEPIGFALVNRESCQVDLRDWWRELEEAVQTLRRAGLAPVLMNAPLCGIPRSLWRYAHQSISDWKRTFAPECDGCMVRSGCAGVFAWYARGWRPTKITAFREAVG
jgi:His-Xaa-Ser system radical SAM maturase HxsC